MSNLSDRVSYIKGLAEGLKLDTETNEGKLIEKILDLLSDLTAEVEALRSDYNDLDEYVEAIDSDLSDMEDLIYDEDGEDDDDGFGGPDCWMDLTPFDAVKPDVSDWILVRIE